jgi:hypothetical protein
MISDHYVYYSVLYVDETWSVTLRENENSMLIVFRPKREEATGDWRKFQMMFVICALKLILLGWSNQVGWNASACNVGKVRNAPSFG